MVDLSIIIVSWNVREYLAACLQSIQRGLADGRLSYEVIIVDSASQDATPEMVRQQFPTTKLMAQSDNIGFVKGNNIGLAEAQGRYVLLLNPDTEVVGDALQTLAAALDAAPKVGIVGPHTLNSDGSTQSSKRRFPTFWTAIFESTWLQRSAPRGILRRYYAEDIPNSAVADVDWMQGSALMARHTVCEQLGGLDMRYVMYSEEVDFCKRAKLAGWDVRYVGTAQIIHHGGKSTTQTPTRAQIYFHQSKLAYFRRFHGGVVANIIRLVLIALYLRQVVMEWLKGLIGHKRDLRQEYVRNHIKVIRALCQAIR
jgi:N-acetylglucosaminyl-diphospho-decaprenol L-rhamnosyltransferase